MRDYPPQSLIDEIRSMIDDFAATNALPGKYDGKDLRDEDIAIAIHQALTRINSIPPRTDYGYGMPSRTLRYLFKELAMYYALEQIAKHLAREIMVTGGNVQVDDDRSRATMLIQLAQQKINEILTFVRTEKQGLDSMNFMIVE